MILPLTRILQRNLKRITDTVLFISHTTNVLLFKFRCNIFSGVRIIKEMLGSVASGTHCISLGTYELRPAVGKAIELHPKVSNSSASYRDSTRSLTFALLDDMEGNLQRNGTTHTSHGRLGRDSSAEEGHQTKVPWTRFDTRTFRFVSSSLIYNQPPQTTSKPQPHLRLY